jgi:hypothetical protein
MVSDDVRMGTIGFRALNYIDFAMYGEIMGLTRLSVERSD